MAAIKLFCSDLDGTLLGNREATRRFAGVWDKLPPAERPLLCYNSGRLVTDILKVIEDESLPPPHFIVGGVGTQLHDGRSNQPVAGFGKQFGAGWDLNRIEQILGAFPEVSRQPPEFLHPYKSSWYLDHASLAVLDALRRRLADAGLNVTLVYSSGRDLDVLPINTGKGQALKWLCQRIQVPLKHVVVAGDSGNDSSMFILPDVQRIVVENAQPELLENVAHLPVYSATCAFADGVLRGLAHFKVVPAAPALDFPGAGLK